MDVITHYDLLIEEENDPFRDPPELLEYMNKWDGEVLLNALMLAKTKRVLEIGIGTGRIADKVAPRCMRLVGIDISPKTIMRAKENLKDHGNIAYICDDFCTHTFGETFDVIYSSLTMMHFKDKHHVIAKINSLLKDGGILCLSIDKNQNEYIDMGTRRLEIYPDTPDAITALIVEVGMTSRVLETEHAYIIVAEK